MSSAPFDGVLAGASLVPEDERIVRRMVDYLHRHSLTVIGGAVTAGGVWELEFTDEADRYAASVDELRIWWSELRAGRRFDWSRLRRIERPRR
jgi:hypothetical protein